MSLISNDCLKLSIDCQVEPQLVPKLLLQISVREIHNSIVSPQEEVGLKEARDVYNNNTIHDSTLHNILPQQLKKIPAQYKLMCGC